MHSLLSQRTSSERQLTWGSWCIRIAKLDEFAHSEEPTQENESRREISVEMFIRSPYKPLKDRVSPAKYWNSSSGQKPNYGVWLPRLIPLKEPPDKRWYYNKIRFDSCRQWSQDRE